MRIGTLALAVSIVLTGCDEKGTAPTVEPPASAKPAATAAPSASSSASPADKTVDAAVVEKATGLHPEVADGIVKVSFPRGDVKLEVDGTPMTPFQGLTSWAGFTPGQKPGVEAMVMGDTVLFEDEVFEAMSAALKNGLKVTALHNHFLYDKPHVFFMHIEGEGTAEKLGAGVKSMIDAVKAVRAKTPQPKDRSEAPAPPAKSAIDAAKVEAAMGAKAAAKDGMAKVTIGRAATTAACGCKVGKAMGVNTWAAFAGTDEDAVVDGDVAVAEDELEPVLQSLTSAGVHVVAIHHHMIGEEPRILFLHFWGRGSVAKLGGALKAAVALTKTSG